VAKCLARLVAAAASLAAVAAAQVAPGDSLPWPGGAGPAIAARGGARCVVWRDATAERAERARRDDAWFAAFGARAPAGFLLVTVVDAPAAVGGDRVASARRSGATPADAGTAGAAWFADLDDGVVVTDGDGVVQFVGAVGAGLLDAVASVLAGSHDLAAARAAHACRQGFASRCDGPDGFAARALGAAMAHAPNDGLLHALRFLLAEASEPAAASSLAAASLQQLAGDPRALAMFVDCAARGASAPLPLLTAAAPWVARAAAAAPEDFAVQVAAARALGAVGDTRAVGRVAVRARRLAHADAAGCLELAAALVAQPEPAVYGDLAAALVERAAALGASARWLAAARCAVALRCRGDADAAAAVLDAYAAGAGAGASPNNDCWRWLTDRATFGRFEEFAIALADRMVESAAVLDYYECDTVAFACLRAGRVADAVAFAERAVAASGGAVAAYGERLRWYRSLPGAVAAPR
jgi:hypothetical protein